MIDPRILAALPKPQLPEGQRRVAEAILSRQPLKAPQPSRQPPVFGDPMQLDPAQQDMFDGLSPADQMLWEDEYQRGVDPAQLYDMFNPSQRENMDDRGGMNRFNDAAAYQVAQADTGTMTDAIPEDLKLTEGQSKDVNYFRRGLNANQTLSDPEMEQALLQLFDSSVRPLGAVGRWLQDENYQKADRAAREFLAMVLRKDTGAQVTNEEMALYGPMYIPMPNDKPGVLEDKRRAREEWLRGMEMGGGTAGPLFRQSREELKPEELSDEDLLRMLQGGQ
jgi:hypothetical protein